MNDRIRQFMNYKGLSSSGLADSIGVQRSNLTHVLNGRNKPSFPFISKLLETYPEINAKWLLLGQGDMLETTDQSPKPDLFANDTTTIKPQKEVTQPEIIKEEAKAPINNTLDAIVPTSTKEIERIVVFYSDNTFQSYNPSK